MNKTIASLIAFTAGGAIGSAVTWIFVKKKYEKIAQEEINSVKEVFAKRSAEIEAAESETVTEEIPVFDEETHEEYAALTMAYGGDIVPNVGPDKPHVISPEEFGELEDYDRVSLSYYADGVLTDENDREIEDVEGTVGRDSLTRFGEYEPDSVFVRDDRLKIDYEILLKPRTYADVLRQKPYLVEDE